MSGIFSDRMSILVYFEGSTVGKLSGFWKCIIIEEERKNLFSSSLTSATIQDSSMRERREFDYYRLVIYMIAIILYNIKKNIEISERIIL